MSITVIGAMASCVRQGPCYDNIPPLDILLFGPIVVALALLAAFLVNRTQR